MSTENNEWASVFIRVPENNDAPLYATEDEARRALADSLLEEFAKVPRGALMLCRAAPETEHRKDFETGRAGYTGYARFGYSPTVQQPERGMTISLLGFR